MIPSLTPPSVQIITEPLGCCSQPLCRSSSFDSGKKDVSFNIFKESGRTETIGKICDKTWKSASVDVCSFDTEGKLEIVNERGYTGGTLDCLRTMWVMNRIGVQTLTRTYTLAIIQSKIHSAAMRSPASPSLAIHVINPSRRVVMDGRSEGSGKTLECIVIGIDFEERTCRVGTFIPEGKSRFVVRLKGETMISNMRRKIYKHIRL